MGSAPEPLWWEMRRAQNRKPKTYRCPLCGNQLPPLLAHVLISPEGDLTRRRHAHMACVMEARKAGRLPTKEDYDRGIRRAAKEARAAERQDQTGRRGLRASASRIRWAFKPRLRRSRPSDS